MPGVRLDAYLTLQQMARSRSQASRLIREGVVYVNGVLTHKASKKVNNQDIVHLGAVEKFVSRAGNKLDNAIKHWSSLLSRHDFFIKNALAIDIGASTGGFTDCLLHHDVKHVVAVDVGHGQLAPTLRQSRQVTVLEKTNARHLEKNMLPYKPSLLVCDVSFISLSKIMPAVIACMTECFWGMLLCKPQFEAGRLRLGKDHVIQNEEVRQQVLHEFIGGLSTFGINTIDAVQASPRGPKGNIEYVVLVSRKEHEHAEK